MPQALACLSTNRKKKPWGLEESGWAEAKVRQSWKHLGDGLVLTTNSTEAIHLPAGCIHAVITLEGSSLVATDFTTLYLLDLMPQ